VLLDHQRKMLLFASFCTSPLSYYSNFDEVSSGAAAASAAQTHTHTGREFINIMYEIAVGFALQNGNIIEAESERLYFFPPLFARDIKSCALSLVMIQ